MYFWISAILSKQHLSSSTMRSYDTGIESGIVSGTRWEWGIGKGQWKRELRKFAKLKGLEGRARAVYFLIGSRYTFNYTGSADAVNALFKSF